MPRSTVAAYARDARIAALCLHRLCPSCGQKRSLLFAEYLDEHLLLALPHRPVG